jgi:hypothetical protein
MAGCKVSARSWKQRGPSMLARQDCCPGYITELCSRFQSQPVVLWQPGICPVHNLPVLISFSFALLLLPLCMCVCVCVSLSLFCVRLVPTFTASHTPTYFPSDDHRHREREREREPFLLVALNFAKQESIRLIISTVVVVSVLSAYGEKMILFVLACFCSFLFFLTFFFWKK